MPLLQIRVAIRLPPLKELFNLPPSLEWLEIKYCNKLRRIFDNQQERPTLNQGRHSTDVMTMTSTDGQELSSSATDNFLPCLKYLLIQMCGSLTEIRNIPQSLRDLTIEDCRNLQFLSGRLDALQQVIILRCGRLRSLDLGDLLALEYLRVYDCKRLASLPNGTKSQAYSSLRINSLPSSVQRRLPRLSRKRIRCSLRTSLAGTSFAPSPDFASGLR
ncbi:hypothetical protein EJB05_48336, partial [Eragrostis curvula]